MKFVLAAYGSRGDTEPCVAVAAELQRRGHNVQLALTVPVEMRRYVESAGLATTPYGRDWHGLMSDEDFTRMLQNPMSAIPQAVEYVARVVTEKTATLVSLAEGADLLVAGMTEQTPAGNVAEYHGIPLAALHFFPAQILQQGSPDDSVSTQSDREQRRALGLPDSAAPTRPLEIQAYDEICVPGLAGGSADGADRPFVGALTLQLPTDTDDEVLSWIAAGAAPVHFGFGSTPISAPADTIAVIGAACAHLGVRALICMDPNDFAGISVQDHVKVVREVNHSTVFPACRAVVHHGGAGTTAAGLRAGVPALVLWNGLDQPVWAASVKHLEVGLGRPFSESTLDSLIADLGEVLTPHHANRAKAVADQMTTPAESLSRAADLLEDAAARGRQG
ncbi:glycosyltransferase [Mycobacterium sp. 1245111.1]|uniref:glycosyltransferase n=1 Tax=Mycobacterium sp. 1245111.1 TaxID=1834073 RepID=UPI000801B8B4|nr:nucleotide disphospho-sugar-binding domain-containing protein [Mycobacterium sp. 1245111.1]OBK36518.1 glycosyltransferase [Mycobacterium sp. 1245111.1]